jgi:hypothetical protein
MIYETLQDFPTRIGQTDVTLRAVNVVGVQESPYSLAREVQTFPGARWELEIAFAPMERADAQKLEAFILSLRGRAGRFRLADPYRSLPLGCNLGKPIVTTAVAGDEVIQSRGWTPSIRGLLLAGDFIELDMHLHQVLADVNSDPTGAASISVWPPLRENSDEYTPIITRNARGVFALAANSAEFTRSVDLLNGTSLRAVEVVNPKLRLDAFTVAAFGDSFANFATYYEYDAIVTDGAGFGLGYRVRADVPNPHLYSVTHVNPGGTGALSVLMTGTALTVTLGRSGGVANSTIDQVRNAVVAAYGDTFLVNEFENGSGPHLAIAAPQTWARPYCYSNQNSVFIWLQTLMRQRFTLARRFGLYSSSGQFNGDQEGDWDFGYPGQRSDQLLGNPGPMGDVLDSVADLIVGCAGANDLLQGASAVQIRDRIVALWDALDAAGRKFVWMEVPPSGTAALQTISDQANAYLRPLAGARGIKMFRWKSSFVSSGAALATYFPDLIHPNDLACYEQALDMLSGFDSFIQPSEPDYSDAADPAWLNSNPTMRGDVAGMATAWSANSFGTFTATKVLATDGGNDWQGLALNMSGGYLYTNFSCDLVTTGFAVGDLVEGLIEAECDPVGWDVKSVMLTLYFRGPTNPGQVSAMFTFAAIGGSDIYAFSLGKAFAGVLRTPPAAIPHGCTGLQLEVRVHGSGNIKLRNGGPRKSTQP